MSQREGFIILSLSKSGQHTTEFVILIGLVTLAAFTMQFMARRGLQTGVKMVNDTILGPPPPPELPDPSEPPSTVQVEQCDGSTLSVTGRGVLMVQAACSDVQEQGDATFRRVTTTSETNRGASVNEDARLQVFEE